MQVLRYVCGGGDDGVESELLESNPFSPGTGMLVITAGHCYPQKVRAVGVSQKPSRWILIEFALVIFLWPSEAKFCGVLAWRVVVLWWNQVYMYGPNVS